MRVSLFNVHFKVIEAAFIFHLYQENMRNRMQDYAEFTFYEMLVQYAVELTVLNSI